MNLPTLAPVATDVITVEAAFHQFDTIERTVWFSSKITDDGTRAFLTHDTRLLVVTNGAAYVHHYASAVVAEAAFDLI
jgi:hypothetical protein